jgi:hypothetical protein
MTALGSFRPWLRRLKRLRRARTILTYANLFPKREAAALLADYAAVCADTQLSLSGLLNLEMIALEVVQRQLPGAFVECGTWRGGALAYWARAFRRRGGDMGRHAIWGFDSFEGMPQMTPRDGAASARWLYGTDAGFEATDGALRPSGRNVAPIEACRRLMAESGYDPAQVHIVKGWFQDTLPGLVDRIGPVAVLRLDGDFYESTRFCLDTLYDSVVPGGYVIIDDYGTFEGCRAAVHEFLDSRGLALHLHYGNPDIRYLIKPSGALPGVSDMGHLGARRA